MGNPCPSTENPGKTMGLANHLQTLLTPHFVVELQSTTISMERTRNTESIE
jgi:hypothetical protein